MDTKNYATDPACHDLLQHLFGDLTELMNEIAPDEWEMSPYVQVRHPTPEQQLAEITAMAESVNQMSRARTKNKKPYTVPTLEELKEKEANELDPVKPLNELLYVYGGCIWSVFSNNHDVTGPTGEVFGLGSFRETGSTIANFLNAAYPDGPTFDYTYFYCADQANERWVDLTSVYALIFKRLKQKQCDWVYSFPRTRLIGFDAPDEASTSDPATYDPNVALTKATERHQRQQEIDRLQAELDQAAEDEMEAARYQNPPMVIRAYQDVYGLFPLGWVNAQ